MFGLVAPGRKPPKDGIPSNKSSFINLFIDSHKNYIVISSSFVIKFKNVNVSKWFNLLLLDIQMMTGPEDYNASLKLR